MLYLKKFFFVKSKLHSKQSNLVFHVYYIEIPSMCKMHTVHVGVRSIIVLFDSIFC